MMFAEVSEVCKSAAREFFIDQDWGGDVINAYKSRDTIILAAQQVAENCGLTLSVEAATYGFEWWCRQELERMRDQGEHSDTALNALHEWLGYDHSWTLEEMAEV
jgi:hypothetical protein